MYLCICIYTCMHNYLYSAKDHDLKTYDLHCDLCSHRLPRF